MQQKSDLLNELNQFEEIKSFELIINGNSNEVPIKF